MHTSKVVKMDWKEKSCLQHAMDQLEQMVQELEELKNADPQDTDLRELWDECNSAYGGLWDFLQTYKTQFTEEDQD